MAPMTIVQSLFAFTIAAGLMAMAPSTRAAGPDLVHECRLPGAAALTLAGAGG
jgi:hypothetical protein